MARPKEPVEVLVAKRKSHLTKEEIERREAEEVKAPVPKRIRYPVWLPKELRRDYRGYARQLIALGIFSDLDGDTLGRYLQAHANYLSATEALNDALERGLVKSATEWAGVQDKMFKQASACARDLGLTISSRCRLIVPAPEDDGGTDPDADLFG